MKNNSTITPLVMLTLLLLVGCNDSKNNNISSTNTNVLSESSFLSGETPSMAENQIMILSLENPGSSVSSNDTSEIGVDCFTIKTTQDISDAVIAFDENLSVSHAVITHKNSGNTNIIDKSDVNKAHTFKAQEEYEYCVYHNGASSNEELFFVRFEPNESITRAANQDILSLKNSKSCIGCDLSNYDFGNITTKSKSLFQFNLSSANLSGAQFHSLDLGSVNFTKANLTDVSMSGNSMVGTIFDDAIIVLNNIYPENINHASFANLDLSGTDFTQINLGGTHNAAFEGVNFKGANLTGANFSQATITSCTFDSADLSANFRSATMEASSFNSANLSGANFRETTIKSNNNFNSANLTGADFSGATIESGTTFYAAQFQNTTFVTNDIGPVFSQPTSSQCTDGNMVWIANYNAPGGYCAAPNASIDAVESFCASYGGIPSENEWKQALSFCGLGNSVDSSTATDNSSIQYSYDTSYDFQICYNNLGFASGGDYALMVGSATSNANYKYYAMKYNTQNSYWFYTGLGNNPQYIVGEGSLMVMCRNPIQ